MFISPPWLTYQRNNSRKTLMRAEKILIAFSKKHSRNSRPLHRLTKIKEPSKEISYKKWNILPFFEMWERCFGKKKQAKKNPYFYLNIPQSNIRNNHKKFFLSTFSSFICWWILFIFMWKWNVLSFNILSIMEFNF